jgi:hypothetical protein
VYNFTSSNNKRSHIEDIPEQGAEENFEPKKGSNEMKKTTKGGASQLQFYWDEQITSYWGFAVCRTYVRNADKISFGKKEN